MTMALESWSSVLSSCTSKR